MVLFCIYWHLYYICIYMSIGYSIHPRHYLIAVVAVMSVALCSCSGGGRPDVKAIFGSISVCRDVALASDDGSPHCTVSIIVHVARGDGEAAQLMNETIIKRLFCSDATSSDVKQAARSFADGYVRHYAEDLRAFYAADKNHPDRKAWYEYVFRQRTHVINGRDSIAVYVSETEISEGIEPEICQKQAINFDLSTGRLITLDDVLVPGYTSRLNDVLLALLMKKTGVRTIDGLRAKGYLHSTDMFVPENYVIGPDFITFIYNVYEIAPLAEGITELTVYNSDINDLLSK